MTLVVDVADLRAALAFDDIKDVNVAIEQAIEQAQQAVADTIRSAIARATITDEFWVGYSLEFGGVASQAELLMSQGFVDGDQTYTAFASSNQKDLSVSNSRANLRNQGGTDHTVWDFEKGLLRITDFDLTRCYVRVSYTAGFTDDGADPPIYENTPNWLIQAVRLKAQIILDANPVLPRPTLREGIESDLGTKILNTALSDIILAHARYVPGSWKPYRSA